MVSGKPDCDALVIDAPQSDARYKLALDARRANALAELLTPPQFAALNRGDTNKKPARQSQSGCLRFSNSGLPHACKLNQIGIGKLYAFGCFRTMILVGKCAKFATQSYNNFESNKAIESAFYWHVVLALFVVLRSCLDLSRDWRIIQFPLGEK